MRVLTRAAFLRNQVEDFDCSGTLLDELLTERAVLQKLGHHQTRSGKRSQKVSNPHLVTFPQQPKASRRESTHASNLDILTGF